MVILCTFTVSMSSTSGWECAVRRHRLVHRTGCGSRQCLTAYPQTALAIGVSSPVSGNDAARWGGLPMA